MKKFTVGPNLSTLFYVEALHSSNNARLRPRPTISQFDFQ